MTTMRLRPDLEDALCTLPDVRAVSVVTSGLGVPTEVHVLAGQGKAPKQVVRDIQSLAMTGFDLDIDHRIVSVVQLEDRPGTDEAPAGEAPTPGQSAGHGDGAPRPVVTAIVLSTALASAAVGVTVRFGHDEFRGDVEGPPTPTARPRLVAEATVQAMAELIGAACEVEVAQVVPTAARRVALVVLSLEVPRIGTQALTGSAVVRSHEEDAVARAVLNALNRHLAG